MKELVTRLFEQFGLPLSRQAAEQLEHYYNELCRVNEVMNLTAITDQEGVACRHFLDSAALLKLPCLQRQNLRVIDVGTGAGFPGLVLRILRPDLQLVLCDALNKRINFLRELCETLGLLDVALVHGRAEELARLPGFREGFDCAVSRAVAALPMLCELTLPFVKVGGVSICMKGPDPAQEAREAGCAIAALGGRAPAITQFDLPDGIRSAVVVPKSAPTPAAYPRPFAQIKKKPL